MKILFEDTFLMQELCSEQYMLWPAASPNITATEFHKFFIDKIAGVRASTDSANSPVYRPASGAVLDVFQPVDVEEMSR